MWEQIYHVDPGEGTLFFRLPKPWYKQNTFSIVLPFNLYQEWATRDIEGCCGCRLFGMISLSASMKGSFYDSFIIGWLSSHPKNLHPHRLSLHAYLPTPFPARTSPRYERGRFRSQWCKRGSGGHCPGQGGNIQAAARPGSEAINEGGYGAHLHSFCVVMLAWEAKNIHWAVCPGRQGNTWRILLNSPLSK